MNRFVVLSINAVASFALLLPFAACSGATDDASIGKTRDGLGTDLKEGDVCPAEKCEHQQWVCGAVDASARLTPTNVRCVAGPQEGSGVGACQLTGECVPETVELKEGDVCPAEKCEHQQFACGTMDASTQLTPTNVRCVAGPQEGSGVGVCQLVGDCL